MSFNLSCLKKILKKRGINRDFESAIGLRRLIHEKKKKKTHEGTWAVAPFREETKRRPRLYRKASLRVKIAHFTSLTVWEVRGNKVAMS